jgi:hypothetical protein
VRSPARRPGFLFGRKSGATMDSEPKQKVEVMEDARALIITVPGTKYHITYRKLADIPGMSGVHDLRQDDPDASLNRYGFLRELGQLLTPKRENSAG